MLSAGDQVPVIPLTDVVGNGDKAAPAQIGATAVKDGVTVELTFTVTTSVMVLPQVLVAVKVSTMLPDALAGKV